MARKGYKHSSEWDELNNSGYGEEDRYEVELDHSKLYITNIPVLLKEDGLKTAFSNYGTVLRVYLSSDPKKRFSIITFETPGEAKLAMTKLNRTEPLKLNIAFAHKNRPRDREGERTERDRNGYNRRQQNDDGSSIGSRNNRKNMSNGEVDMDLPIEELNINDEFDLDVMDPNIHLELELEQIKLKQLELQEQQVRCKQRMLILKQGGKKSSLNTASTNRHITPDGRIVVRNVNDRNLETRNADGAFGAGAGDSNNIPALQRDPSRVCVTCGKQADQYCARCGVAPYCSTSCQRRDWRERHRSVCHNLALYGNGADVQDSVVSPVPALPPAAPLRRPYSPAKNAQAKREFRQPQKSENGDADKQDKVFTPASQNRQNQTSSGHNQQLCNQMRNNSRPMNRNMQRNHQDKRRQDVNETQEEDWGKPKTETVVPEAKITPKQSVPSQRQQTEVPKENPAPKPVKEDKPVPVKINTEVKQTSATQVMPGSVNDVTPIKKFVPKNYLLELLSIGDSVMLSVDNDASACATQKPGYICLAMNEKHSDDYTAVCDDYGVECEADGSEITPNPGEAFSYFSPEDCGWYRARSLGNERAALLDSSKVVKLSATDKCKRMSEKFEKFPEFSCFLDAKNVKVGDCLSCTITSKTQAGYKLTMKNGETDTLVGEGEVSRWTPDVEYPTPRVDKIPQVLRPALIDKAKVILVDARPDGGVAVRLSDDKTTFEYDQTLQDVVNACLEASPLKELPTRGSTVVGKFDGIQYRALVQRVNSKQNKCLLEYIDFGNKETTSLEDIYPCPIEYSLTSKPTLVSQATLQVSCTELNPEAMTYLHDLRDKNEELILNLTTGDKAPSGSAVRLTVAKSKESVNDKIDLKCKPVWKKMDEEGCKVMAMPPVMFGVLTYIELPKQECELVILDANMIETGALSVYRRGEPYAERVFNELSQKLLAYVNSDIGRQPYLPEADELCVAQCPPYPQWFRGLVLSIKPGDQVADILFIDYGNVAQVPINLLRKMMPEFVIGYPALVCHCEIKDFPELKPQQLSRALEFMKIDTEGKGILKVTSTEKVEDGYYKVEAPELLAALKM